jgi:hypothetical protein
VLMLPLLLRCSVSRTTTAQLVRPLVLQHHTLHLLEFWTTMIVLKTCETTKLSTDPDMDLHSCPRPL